MGRRNLHAILGVLTALAVLSAAPISAAAATTNEAGKHCVVEVHPIDSTELPAEPVCFDTPAEAAAYLGSIGVGVTAGSGIAASTIVGMVYRDYNEGGESLTFWGSSGCTGVTFGFPSLASGWDNSISSARASNGCWVTLYTNTSYGGSRLNCTPYCASIGSWNDNVKSLVFRPEGTFG